METPTTIPKRGGIGSDDFKKLVIKNSYVDKSLFVKDIIEDSHDVILITRPRRWGKSSNMSLLQTFLEIEVDKEGNPLPEAQKENPVYFTGGIIEEDGIEETLSPLKVIDKVYYSAEKDYETYRKTMNKLGKDPVILINFKDLGGSSCEELVEGLKVKLRKLFTEYKYLLASPHLDVIDKDLFTAYLY